MVLSSRQCVNENMSASRRPPLTEASVQLSESGRDTKYCHLRPRESRSSQITRSVSHCSPSARGVPICYYSAVTSTRDPVRLFTGKCTYLNYAIFFYLVRGTTSSNYDLHLYYCTDVLCFKSIVRGDIIKKH